MHAIILVVVLFASSGNQFAAAIPLRTEQECQDRIASAQELVGTTVQGEAIASATASCVTL